tara:strand:- start:113 stop:640 length:528 start_codon:yes stop_codon:yes gene_type:complete
MQSITKDIVRDFIQEKDDQVKYDLFLTLPLNKRFQNLKKIELSSLLKSFIVNLNREIFTKRELVDYFNPKTIQCIPVRENNETSIHIILKCPVSKKLPDNDLKYLRLKSILEKQILKFKLFNPYQINDYQFTYYHKFCKKIYSNAVDMINYTLKRESQFDVDFDTIDITNVRVID